MSFYETLLNLVALLFWFGFWNPDSRDIFFNPYVLRIRSLSDALIDAVMPMVRRQVSRRMVAGLLLLAVLALKGFLYYSGLRGRLAFGIDSALPGVSQSILTPYAPQLTDADLGIAPMGIFAAKVMLFSCASFGVFVFNIWTVAMIYLGTRRATGLSRAEGTLFSLAKPITSIAPELRPFLLLGLGMSIVGARAIFLRGIFPYDLHHTLLFLAKAMLSSVSAAVSVIHTLVIILGTLVVLTWFSMFSMSAQVGLMCREWLDLFLGPFRDKPIRFGNIDASPFVLAFILVSITQILQHLVLTSYAMLQ
jgi:uncharacterized protein YggT (Ycf19 family)